MKRNLFFAAVLMGVGSMAFGQTTPMTNKNGLTITPEAGDWGLGMNAAPILGYVGNMFNGTAGNAAGTGFVTGNPLLNSGGAIYGKYFIDANTAYRGTFRISSASTKTVNLQDTTQSAQPQSDFGYVENITKTSGFGFALGAGMEWRKGHNRIQGYYGGDVLLTFGGVAPNSKTDYALALDSVNFNSGYVTNGRTLSTKAGASFGLGLRGFVGVEYFVAPKLSLGAEFGWGIGYIMTGEGETVKEYYGPDGAGSTANVTYTRAARTGKSSSFVLGTDNLAGSIRLMFHF